MRKPVSVKILEWWFGLLAGVASLLPLPIVYGAVREENWDLLLPTVGLCIGILFFWRYDAPEQNRILDHLPNTRSWLERMQLAEW